MASAPQLDVLAASHTTQLAAKRGRRVRNFIADHGPVLGISLASDMIAAHYRALLQGGEYHAVGVGVGTAYGPVDLASIDDPICTREDACSPLVRDKIWNWYKADLSPHIKPDGRIILI
jgi:hypothetical protein